MIPEETINKFLRDIINLLLSSPGYTIKAEQKDTPRPEDAYADVTFVNDVPLGWEQTEYENNTGDNDLTETISGMREVMMSIGFYRDNSIDNARTVRMGLLRESIQDLFRAANMGISSRSQVRKISEPLENGWEERAQFDIVLSAVGTDTDIARSILSVDIAGAYQSRGLEYNFNI